MSKMKCNLSRSEQHCAHGCEVWHSKDNARTLIEDHFFVSKSFSSTVRCTS